MENNQVLNTTIVGYGLRRITDMLEVGNQYLVETNKIIENNSRHAQAKNFVYLPKLTVKKVSEEDSILRIQSVATILDKYSLDFLSRERKFGLKPNMHVPIDDLFSNLGLW